MSSAGRVGPRASYFFLCVLPFLAIALAAVRALRTPGLHQVIGGAVFVLVAFSLWTLTSRARRAEASEEIRLVALAGSFLILPFALIALLWVGLGPPWQANAAENQMRYVVLVVIAGAVVVGLVVLKEALSVAGERCYSMLGFAGILLAGPLYMIGETILLAAYAVRVRTGEVPPVFLSLSEWQDILLFFGGAFAYAATAAFAISLWQARWLGRGACWAFSAVSLIAMICLIARGLQFPDPAALSAPWWTVPGLIAGIPAMPFIIPGLFGAIALRRASREE